jgi:hypothetical protein
LRLGDGAPRLISYGFERYRVVTLHDMCSAVLALPDVAESCVRGRRRVVTAEQDRPPEGVAVVAAEARTWKNQGTTSTRTWSIRTGSVPVEGIQPYLRTLNGRGE